MVLGHTYGPPMCKVRGLGYKWEIESHLPDPCYWLNQEASDDVPLVQRTAMGVQCGLGVQADLIIL